MFEMVVIGVSAGGMQALLAIVSALPESFALPIAVVQHIAPHADNYLVEYLNRNGKVTVKEAEDKERLRPGHVYLAPAGYHLLIEPDRCFSLSVDARVNYSCPAIDVLFESAADIMGDKLIGVVLTGANGDGSQGLKKIKAQGGLAIVQNPATAQYGYMPRAAVAAAAVDHIVDLEQVAPLLQKLSQPQREAYA